MKFHMSYFSLIIFSFILVSTISMIIAIIEKQQQLSHAQIKQDLSTPILQEFLVPSGSRPHDVAPALGGAVWYTAQGTGQLGRLDPITGRTHHIPLGKGSAPHGVIIGPDGAPWITDGGLNAIVRVDPVTEKMRLFSLPQNSSHANLNTATFDHNGVMWFTGQSGIYGTALTRFWERQKYSNFLKALDHTALRQLLMEKYTMLHWLEAYIARINLTTGTAKVLDPPTQDQGARRIWSDSHGRLWISEWNAGKLALYDPNENKWQEWRLPGGQPFAVCCLCR